MQPIFVRKSQGDPVCAFVSPFVYYRPGDMQWQLNQGIAVIDYFYRQAGLVTARQVFLAVEERIALNIGYACFEHMRSADASISAGREFEAGLQWDGVDVIDHVQH